MARPKKQGLDYFPHDVDASNDEKIEAMEAVHGALGYSFAFKMMERVYRAGGELNLADDPIRRVIAEFSTSKTPEKFDALLRTALDVKLFDKDRFAHDQVVTSDGIRSRCSKVSKERKRKANYKKTGNLGKTVSDVQNSGETSEVPGFSFRESKGNKRKEKKKKTPHSPPGGEPKKICVEFEEARKAFPGVKRDYDVEFANFVKQAKKLKLTPSQVLPLLLPAVRRYKAFTEKKARQEQRPPFWQHLKTWVNNQGWTAEYPGESVEPPKQETPGDTAAREAAAKERQAADDAATRARFQAAAPDEQDRIRERTRLLTGQVPDWMVAP